MNGEHKSRLPLYAFLGFAFAMYAAPAEAHLNSTGIGPGYDGLTHFLMSPEDIVPVLALTLLAGLRGAVYGRRALFTVPCSWLLGGFAGLSAVTAVLHPFVSAAWFLLMGGLLAADAKLSLRMTTVLDCTARDLSPISERNWIGHILHLSGGSVRFGVRCLRSSRTRGGIRRAASRRVGAHRYACGR